MGGAHFVTPMALAALSENQVHTSLWDLKNEVEMGHIQLSRQADVVVVCPATADLMARMAAGIADDLATTLLLATDKPVLAAPAMNVRMWQHPATVRNVERLRGDGLTVLEPDEGEMACGEYGPGRLPEPEAIVRAIESHPALSDEARPGGPPGCKASTSSSRRGRRTSRSIRCGCSPTDRLANRVSPSPRRLRAEALGDLNLGPGYTAYARRGRPHGRADRAGDAGGARCRSPPPTRP
jgi:phosphopantothenoylcysteine decarboxylase/phosphopantothenate--cysteine ligase